MPKITFLPMNLVCEAAAGETILDIAIANDVPLQHACGGFCACTTCQLEVQDTAGKALSEMEEEEMDRLDGVPGATPRSRLGCQAKLMGDITVQIVHVD